MKPFSFKQFNINQSEKVFRIGTDAVLLGALAGVFGKQNILEIGTGTGIISLMLAQRNSEASITAIDINLEAVGLARENFENAPFKERLKAFEKDFKTFDNSDKFDFVVSNPPYFDANSSTKDILARQRIELDFSDLICNTAKILSVDGIFSVIIPADERAKFINLSKEHQLYLTRKIDVYGIAGGTLRRNILEFSKNSLSPKVETFIIEKAPRQFSEQYLQATKDFHLFK